MKVSFPHSETYGLLILPRNCVYVQKPTFFWQMSGKHLKEIVSLDGSLPSGRSIAVEIGCLCLQ
jgi:hypothetical protein